MTTARWALAGVFVLAVVGAGLGGCGGDGNAEAEPSGQTSTQAAAAPSADEFLAEAGPICNELSKQVTRIKPAHSFPAELDDFDRWSSKFLAVSQDDVDELAAMTPPAEWTDEYHELTTKLRESIQHAEQVQELVLAKNDDTDALWQASTQSDTARARAMEIAAELDLAGCTELQAEGGH